ncbi:MAG: PASTA domain-containing protein [Nocardioides sp.]|uniref:PASTA domain-containing protein n=1 Tax=Nocardioides sp. TaxID=35761 RepID=UPI003F07ADFD
MDESKLAEGLSARVADTRVGAAPVAEMVAEARRRSRQRRTLVIACAAAGAVVVGSTALGLRGADRAPVVGDPSPGPRVRTTTTPAVTTPTTDSTPDDDPEPLPDPGPVPAGYRLVGSGPLAVAVPEAWARNSTRCGTPLEDTYVIDSGAICLAYVPRDAGVEALNIVEGHRPYQVDENYEERTLDGELVRISAIECASLSAQEGGVLCQGVLYAPGPKVGFIASSSTHPIAAARLEVERMLAQVRLLDGEVAVPDWVRYSNDHQRRSGARYVAALEELGFTVETTTRVDRGWGPGFVRGVEPVSGTILPRGATVTVTVSGR